VDDYSAYQSAEVAELYDAVYAGWNDIGFWETLAREADEGPLLELACGTGRILVPLARAGHEVTGLDVSPRMIERCREKLQAEPPEVQARVTLVEGGMASFDLGRRFGHIYVPFGSFHHLQTADEQLGCLESCAEHLLPGGTLVLDLINPDPVRSTDPAAEQPDNAMSAGPVDWTEGRQVSSWATVLEYHPAQQYNDVQVTYEVTEPNGSTWTRAETFPIRFVFRYEVEHLLARAGFVITALYGDYDRSPFADESLGMILVAKRSAGPRAAESS